MANGFQFQSEMPGYQAPQPQSQGGGGQGLLNVLSSIGSGLLSGLQTIGQGATALSAGIQAGRGNIGPLMMLQQQAQMQQQEQQRQNLIGQLQTFAEEADPDVKDLIQNQLKFGQPDAALKTAANASTFGTFKRGLETSGLSPELKKTASNLYLTNPDKAVDYLRSLEILNSQMGLAKEKEELRRETRESRTTVKLLQEGFQKGILDPTAPNLAEAMQGYMKGRDKNLSLDDIATVMRSPELLQGPLKNMPPGGYQKLVSDIMNFFFRPQQQQAPAPAAPAAPQQPSGVRRFNPATGRLE